jgi:uncharacterized membrane protein
MRITEQPKTEMICSKLRNNVNNTGTTRYREKEMAICCVNSVYDSYVLTEILINVTYRNLTAELERVERI